MEVVISLIMWYYFDYYDNDRTLTNEFWDQINYFDLVQKFIVEVKVVKAKKTRKIKEIRDHSSLTQIVGGAIFRPSHKSYS